MEIKLWLDKMKFLCFCTSLKNGGAFICGLVAGLIFFFPGQGQGRAGISKPETGHAANIVINIDS